MLHPLHFYNILTTNHRWLVVISSNLNLPDYFYTLMIKTSNNLPFMIYCENIMDIAFFFNEKLFLNICV